MIFGMKFIKEKKIKKVINKLDQETIVEDNQIQVGRGGVRGR